jgi:hypothetical protein
MIARAISLLTAVSLSTACASVPGVYAELGAGVKVNSSRVLEPDCHTVILDGRPRSCGGDNPTGHLSIGYEFSGRRGRCELLHQSHVLDGGADRETYVDQVACFRRWGGRSAR